MSGTLNLRAKRPGPFSNVPESSTLSQLGIDLIHPSVLAIPPRHDQIARRLHEVIVLLQNAALLVTLIQAKLA